MMHLSKAVAVDDEVPILAVMTRFGTFSVEIDGNFHLTERSEVPLTTNPSDTGISSKGNPVISGFMSELEFRCQCAEIAYTAIVLALSERGPSGALGLASQRKVFAHVDAFLWHAALVTRVLWPSDDLDDAAFTSLGQEKAETVRAIHHARGEQIRNELGSEVSLLDGLGLWDYVTRLDERIQVWTLTSPVDESKGMTIAASREVTACEPNAVRQLNSITMMYSFLGQHFDLSAIAAVLSWLHRAAAQWKARQP